MVSIGIVDILRVSLNVPYWFCCFVEFLKNNKILTVNYADISIVRSKGKKISVSTDTQNSLFAYS